MTAPNLWQPEPEPEVDPATQQHPIVSRADQRTWAAGVVAEMMRRRIEAESGKPAEHDRQRMAGGK